MSQTLLRCSPESQGVSSRGILRFIEAVDAEIHEMHSFMLLRRGSVLAEGWWQPYRSSARQLLYSLSKSFTSSAVGFAVAEGRLSVDDAVVSFFPDETPANPEPNLAQMRVRHLLSMSTGHDVDAMGRVMARPDHQYVRAMLKLPVEHIPGTHFAYNSGATYLLSAIVQKLTGQKVVDYLRPRLFESLGIQHPTWEESPEGITIGAWGLSVTTEEIARFGQLYLQKGAWQGRQLLPEAWVQQATSWQVKNGVNPESDWEQGYGFQFWRCRHGAYRGDGAFGQYCIVLPDQEAVIAITAAVDDMQPVLNMVWDRLLPEFCPAALPEDPAAQAALSGRLERLVLPTPAGAASSPTGQAVSGKRYLLQPNGASLQALSLDFTGPQPQVTLELPRGSIGIPFAHGAWQDIVLPFVPAAWLDTYITVPGEGPRPAAAAGAWSGPDIFRLQVRYYEIPGFDTLDFKFTGENLELISRANVAFGPKEHPPLFARQA